MTARLIVAVALFAACTGISLILGGKKKYLLTAAGALLAAVSIAACLVFDIYGYGAWAVLASILFLMSVEDARSHSFPVWMLAPLTGAVLFCLILLKKSFVEGCFSGLISIALFAGLYFLFRRKGIGLGDVLVFPVLAFLFRPPEAVVFLLLASASGMVYSAAKAAVVKKPGRIAFLPFISVSALAVLARGNELVSFFRLDYRF